MPNHSAQDAKKFSNELREALPAITKKGLFGISSTEFLHKPSGIRLVEQAEAALHRAHERGNWSIAVYDPEVDRIVTQAPETQDQPIGDELEEVGTELEAKNVTLERALTELHDANQQLKDSFLEVTKSLVLAMESKDPYTAGHLERVGRYAARLAEVLNLSDEEVEAIREAAILHDIGKMHLPDEVLHKIGLLTEEERNIIKQHLEFGAQILEPMKFFKPITSLLYHHHERFDGKGYPHGLTGDLVPPGAQIITIADSFDAMTTNRGYNKPKSLQEAIEELRRGSGTQFNPGYVTKFIDLISREGKALAGYKAK